MKPLLAQLVDGQPLSAEQAVEAFDLIMSGKAEPTQTAALLSMIALRGATVDELAGAATVMRRKAAKVTVPDGLTAIDTCGTGGDHAGTFNISTAAALVAAGAGRELGVCVAKHGNKSVTSKSGSSQVLDALGVNLKVETNTLTKCLDQAGICFCFAPAHHPAMKHAGPVRADLGFRTLFNLVGPLTNPAGAKRQVMGVFDAKLTETIAQVLKQLGTIHALIVHGQIPDGDGTHSDALDELSTCGPSKITKLLDGTITTAQLDPTELGLSLGHPSALRVDGPEQSAKVIRGVLEGKPGAAREIIALNAAAALVVAGVAGDLSEGLELAMAALDDGKALAALDNLVKITQSAAA